LKIGEFISGSIQMMAVGAVLAAAPSCGAAPAIPRPAVQASGRWRDASLDDYRKHLMQLRSLVEACAKARDLKTCDPVLVGPDDRIPLGTGANAERRRVRYGWLRVLFSKAEEPDAPAAKAAAGSQGGAEQPNAPPAPPTTSQLLQDAEVRLAAQIAQSDSAPAVEPVHTTARDAMKLVLAGKDFRNLEEPSARDSMMEKVNNWLNRLFENAARIRAHSPWVGRLIVWGFILAVCVALAWGLIQLERRWRVRLVPDDRAPAPSAASARDWQLWLEDARRAAAAGQWREAIHFVYWASISRLESRRLWPADRARTPREYLALVAADDPRKSGLAQLTGSFERTWYGGRAAAEGDYRHAEELASALIRGVGTGGVAEPSGAAMQGGAQ
jgi:Domain of unknown function (DUF4129)